MKQITAIIQPHMLGKVEHALHALPHFPGYTLLRAKGHGRGRADGHAYHPTEWDMDAHNKVALFILCSDEFASLIVEAIRQNAHTGLPGDGVIAVCEATELLRIGSGERGNDAV
ncbi:MAG: P-II family nitrogen regulator [Burkholderiales bacterium]|nr:P-II family nitrogen regulator [Burkholderiales bacterium]